MSYIKFKWSAWSKYFEKSKLVEERHIADKENLPFSFKVHCLLCKPNITELTVSYKSSWNLKRHVKNRHRALNEEILNYVKEFDKSQRESDLGSSTKRKNVEEPEGAAKQLKLTTAFKKVSQKELNKLIVDAVVDAMLSFSFLENSSVRKLLEAGFPGKVILNRKSVIPLIEKEFQKLQEDLQNELHQQKYVCLTSDSWTSYRRAFIGVTAHWICQKTFKRKSAALAFKRIVGSQTGVVLAKKIEEVITFYELHGKVTKVITDNGANYVKSFKLTEEETNTESHDDEPECFVPVEITDLLSEVDVSATNVLLPEHERCSAHNFNLVMSKDMDAYSFSTNFASLRDSTLSKCKEQNRSSKVADLIKSKIGRYLLTPVCVRWNSLHKSLKLVSKVFKTQNDDICGVIEALKIEPFSSREIEFLDEYVKVVDIVANALNVMQGENFMYTGLSTPTLLHVQEKLDNLPSLQYCTELCGAIKTSIEKRFPKVLDDSYLKATLLHPFFKNYKFLKNDRANIRLRNRLI
ncbi:hypothetical protein Bhyg_00408 [Pseudolycoriella hygida]|uniref:Transposase n=1 Tax=Pseudolycoriella hygida TaxID=35572 RepID=A0A9Q0S6J4_9DIPT|nr:hypothetical protein Bhyg_00408 [Pseudolycoriella hygida]